MNGGIPARANWGLVIAATGFVFAMSAPAASADLGGDCCADLEERVAELEATTARKGNRKVSLTISGWVNEAVFGWDDGAARGVYQGTNSLEQSRFRFTGEAKIDKDWSAGYLLEIGVQGMPSSQFSQSHDVSTSVFFINQDSGMIVRKDNWFIKNKDLGQIAVGLNGTATYHLLDDADAANTRSFADAEGSAVYMGSFLIRSGGNFVGTPNLKWTDVLRGFNNSTPGQGGRRSVVRYDSPTWAGFVVTAAWGQSDQWDAALTYKGEWNGISVLAKAGYGSSNDPGATPVAGQTLTQAGTACGGTQPGIDPNGVFTPIVNNYECTWEGAAATIKHDPTGLYVYGGWGKQRLGNFLSTPQPSPPGITAVKLVPEQDSSTWFIQPGIEQKWLPLGKTTIFGEYRHDDPGSNQGKTVDANITFWQGGVVQNIEAAAMDLYVVYQHAEGTVTGNAATQTAKAAPNGVTPIDAFQEIIAGGKINF